MELQWSNNPHSIDKLVKLISCARGLTPIDSKLAGSLFYLILDSKQKPNLQLLQKSASLMDSLEIRKIMGNWSRFKDALPQLQFNDLTWLSFFGFPIESGDELSDDELKALLEKCPKLQKIDLSHEISSAAFTSENIKLDCLTKINMICCRSLTDDQLQALLEKSPNLQEINFSFGMNLGSKMKITGASFTSENVRLEHLIVVDMSDTELTDDHLKALLEKCPNLQRIGLARTEITGAAFTSTNIRLERLTRVNLLSCYNLTYDHLKALLEKSPNLKVINLSKTENLREDTFKSLLERFSHLKIF
jgi:uncharacterized protein YjbI with pentapeptide repeats